MAKKENPPFPRGSTFYDGATIDSNNLGGVQYEGTIWEFEDVNLTGTTTGAKATRTNRPVKCMIVRNVGAAAILPKRLVTFQTGGSDGRSIAGKVDGYATTTAAEGYPVDEWLPAAGCPVNDLCYIVIDGPATVLSDLAGAANNVVNVGSVLVALTAVTSGATTAGRVAPQDLTGATALLANQVQNRLGRAMSARTTANTNADILIDVRKW